MSCIIFKNDSLPITKTQFFLCGAQIHFMMENNLEPHSVSILERAMALN